MEAFDYQKLATTVNHARMAHYPNHGLCPSRARKQTIAALSTMYPRCKVKPALAFIDLVREAFETNTGAYNEFFNALRLYESNLLDLKDTVIRLMLLCSGSPALLRALNTFLPQGWALNVAMGDVAVELVTPDERVMYPLVPSVPRFR